MMWDLMKFKKVYLLFSVVVLLPGVLSLIFFGLNLAIDFTGGAVFEYKTDLSDKSSIEEIKNIFAEKGVEIKQLSEEDTDTLIIKTGPMDNNLSDEINATILEDLSDKSISQSSFESLGPSIGKEMTAKALRAVGYASLGILLYITFAFRNVAKPYSGFRFGVSALVAMLHDALMLVGLFSILGRFAGVEVDILFITAVLTVIGFSVHDTIVVFDRIRENLNKLPVGWSFERVVNFSLVETLNRSFATSLTVLITLLALFLLGGASIRTFVLALLLGILSGTFSSIFTASPLLVLWEEKMAKKKIKRD